MKYSQWRPFEKHLESAAPSHFSDVYLVISKEEFEKKNAENAILRHLGGSASSLPSKVLEGESTSPDVLQGELNSFSLFASGRQIVVLRNIDKLKAASKEVLEAYLANPSRSHYLLLTAESLPSNTNLYKKAEKCGVIFEGLNAEKPWEKEPRLLAWLQEQAALSEKNFEPQAAQALLKQIGLEVGLLHQELEKLICYVGERKAITLSDVNAICLHFPTDTIWQFGEAIFRQQAGTAFQVVRGLLKESHALIPLLRQLRTQFQTGYQVCSLLLSGGSAMDVSSQFPYLKGALLQKQIDLARGFGHHRYKQGLILIDQTEVLAKNSSIDPDLLIDTLIIKLTTLPTYV